MSAQEALAAARAAGVEVRLDGKDLALSSASEPKAGILAMLSGHKAAIVEYLQAAPAERASCAPDSPLPPPGPIPVRPWPAGDWRLFHNDRQLVAEVALGKTRGQARTYAYICCIREWCRVRPGSSEERAIAALAEKGIVDPSPPPPARHKAAIVEHPQATGSEDDLPPSPAGAGAGAGTDADITGSTDIAAPQRPQEEDGWLSEDWRAYRDERAAIAEFDDGLSRPEAEARAYQACLAEWLDRHPASSSPEAGCVVCSAMDRPGDGLLPVGIGIGTGRTWLHRDCIPIWRSARMDAAAEALSVMGITSKVSSS